MRMTFAFALIATAGTTTVASAHYLGDTDSSQPAAKWAASRLDFMPIDRVPSPRTAAPGLVGAEYVIVLPNKWAQTQKLRVCFVGGSDALRAKILGIADIWIAHTNLKLDAGGPNGRSCAANDSSEIRIGFSEPGYWSYIGHDSISPYLISHNLTSMNFAGFDSSPPAEPQFTGAVLHEWGHALGLHHEHQNPAGGCDAEYDWPKLYAYYQSNYGWDKSKVDANLRSLSADRSAFDWSNQDPNSNMIYASDPNFLKNGTSSPCYFHANNSLSALDIVGIERTYPKGGAATALQLQSVTLPVAIQNIESGALKSALERQNELATKAIQTK